MFATSEPPSTPQDSEFFASPAVVGDLVLAGAGSGTMYGFYAADGAVAWRFQTGTVVQGTRPGSGRAPITSSVVVTSDGAAGFVGGWDGRVYCFDPLSGKIAWQYQVLDNDTNTAAQIRATPALSRDGALVFFPAGRALYAVGAATGDLRWAVQTAQVVYTSPTVAGDGIVIFGGSGGGMATAVSPAGKVVWSLNLTEIGSTMGAVTADGAHVLLIGSPSPVGGQQLLRIEVASGKIVQAMGGVGGWQVSAAAISVDAGGTAFVPVNHGFFMISPHGNATFCGVGDGRFASVGAITIPMDGVVLIPGIIGGLRAMV